MCVFFNQKPQIAATQKMTINHPDSSREKGKERDREIKEDSRDTQRAERTRSQTQSQTEGAVLSNTFNAWIYHDDAMKKSGYQKRSVGNGSDMLPLTCI